MASSPEGSETPGSSPPPSPPSPSSSSPPSPEGGSPPPPSSSPPPNDSSPPPAPKEASPPTSSSGSPPKQDATPPPPSSSSPPPNNASPPPAPISPPPADSKTPNASPPPTPPSTTAATPPPPQVSPPPAVPGAPGAPKENPTTPPAPRENPQPYTPLTQLAPPPPHRPPPQQQPQLPGQGQQQSSGSGSGSGGGGGGGGSGSGDGGGGGGGGENSSAASGDSPAQNFFDGNGKFVVIGGGVALLIALAAICIVCMRKKKKEPWPHGQMQYYGDPAGGRKGENYYNNGPNWYGPQSMEQSHNGPPQPPGYMGHPGGGWGHSPPLAPVISSGEMSSNFSGPHQGGNPASPMALGFNKSTFTYDELAAATNGFSQANLLGQGGFGYVHKGTLSNGKVVAVKSLKSGSGQGEREFQAEVDIISRVHHRHLVSLVGYCIAGGQRMLVYEFVPNGTMEHHLHGNSGAVLDWSKRLTIAVGSAKGLAYLHEDCHPRIIHRDIKAANILIDNNYEAMVADFGLAKLSADNFTHVSTRVMGTFGYLAPEYASSGKLTEKSDVFSFGVMLLELITGRRPVDTTNKYMDDSLVDWARPILTNALADGVYDDIVDSRLGNEYNSSEMKRMIACASASVRHSAKRRPKMSQIVRALEGDVSLDDLNEGVRTTTNQGSGSNMSSEYTTRAYNEDLQKFRKMAFESQEGPEYTSTYGLNPSSSSEGSVSREVK